jgi:hypothetical protein
MLRNWNSSKWMCAGCCHPPELLLTTQCSTEFFCTRTLTSWHSGSMKRLLMVQLPFERSKVKERVILGAAVLSGRP